MIITSDNQHDGFKLKSENLRFSSFPSPFFSFCPGMVVFPFFCPEPYQNIKDNKNEKTQKKDPSSEKYLLWDFKSCHVNIPNHNVAA